MNKSGNYVTENRVETLVTALREFIENKVTTHHDYLGKIRKSIYLEYMGKTQRICQTTKY